MQLPAISPAQRHLASVISKHLAIGPNFDISPEIPANLVEVVEIGSENLSQVRAPRLRMRAGKPWQCDVRVDQQVETRIEQVKGHPAGRLQMAANGIQRFSLQIDCQQGLEGTKGHEDEAKAPTQIQRAHVLID